MNLLAATKSQVYLKGDDGRSLVLCGNVGDEFGFDITLSNLDASRSYKFKPVTVVTTDKVNGGRYTLENELLKNIDSSEIVEVPAGGEIKVHIDVDVADSADAQNELQPQGYYVEGFTQFEAIDGGINLSIPFVAFKGDWDGLPAIEDSIYNLSENRREPMYYDPEYKRSDFTHFAADVDGKYEVCGKYKDSDGEIKYDKNRIAFSPNNDGKGDSLRFTGTFVRCYKTVKFGIYAVEDTAREHPLALAYNNHGGVKNFNNDLVSPRSHTEPDWEWSGSSIKEGAYDAVIQVGSVKNPQKPTTLLHKIIVDKTAPKVEKAVYDSATRMFAIERVSDKMADGGGHGSGVYSISLSYVKSGEKKEIVMDESSDRNIGSEWHGTKRWLIPEDVKLDGVTVEITDFAFNSASFTAKELTAGDTPTPNPPSGGSGGSGGSSGGSAAGGTASGSNGADGVNNSSKTETDTKKSDAVNFSDVSDSHWASAAVKYVAAKKIFNGTGDNKFSPSEKMTRGMFVTALARYFNGTGETPAAFRDVKSGDYYASSVGWALEKKIINGISAGEFGSGFEINREQVAAILYRAITSEGKAPKDKKAVSRTEFKDASSISPFAKEAVGELVAMGILTGRDGDLFAPKDRLTRAEAAAIFHRLDTVLK